MKIYTRKLPPQLQVSVLVSLFFIKWPPATVFHGSQNPEDAALLMATEEYQEEVTTSPFLYLTLDLPTTPLFQVGPYLLLIQTDKYLFRPCSHQNNYTHKGAICLLIKSSIL